MQKCDTTRLEQDCHDKKLFKETTELLDRFYTMPSRKNTCISSEQPAEVLCDYFKDAKFSRG